MYIEKVILENFRNYEKQEVDLINGINLFLGDNAQGKTNIIEALYICAFGKSYRTLKDSELIMFNKQFCTINTLYRKNERERCENTNCRGKSYAYDLYRIFLIGISDH